MRINAVNGNLYQTNKMNPAKKVSNNNKNLIKADTANTSNQVAFKSTMGKVVGGILGMGAAGIATVLALANPVGLVAAGVTLAAEVGGAMVGGAVGDAVSGKDDD